jgi:predicted Zn finger-like uncharacterized protein
MRIVCDSCGTKYSIGDDKIKGKVFKIRCKKCSHVIIVRGLQGAEGGESGPVGGGAGEAVWYVVRGGQQDGPHSPEALSALLSSGEVTLETYTWREGFSDWVPFASVGELAHLLGGAHHQEPSLGGMDDDSGYGEENEATRVAGGLFDAGPSSMDARRAPAVAPVAALFEPEATQAYSPENLFQGAPAPMAAPSPQPAATRPEPMMFAPAMAQAPAPEPSPQPIASFSAAATKAPAKAAAKAEAPASGARNGQRSDMVGARSENSVLFSLNTLAKTEASAEAEAAPTNTEASGLIDIRALSSSAAAVSNARSQNHLPDPLAGPMVAGPAISIPDMMPMGTRKSNAPLFAAIGVGLFLILLLAGGLGGYFFYVKDKQPETIVMNNPNAVAANANANPEAPKADAPKADEKKDAAPAEDKKDEAPAAEDKKDDAPAAEDKKDEAAPSEEDKAAALERKDVKDERTPEQKKADLERAKEERERRELERKEREAAALTKKDEVKKEEPAKEDPKPSKGGDSIDDIIGGIGKAPKKDPAPAEKEAPPVAEKKDTTPPPAEGQKLDKGVVQNVVRRYHGNVSGCAKGQSGTVMVRFTINPNGSVAGAQVVTDAFKGTPAGGCVVGVVRSMKFPTSTAPLTINYPFKL